MNLSKKQLREAQAEQFEYLGRWVDKKGFRAFVYDEKGNEKLANSFEQFESLLATGLWFVSKADAAKGKKNGPVRANG